MCTVHTSMDIVYFMMSIYYKKNCTGGKQFHVQNIFEYSFQV